MEDMGSQYDKLKQDFENYRKKIESRLKNLMEENSRFERDLNSLVNIVEISRFINIYFNDERLIALINEMIINALGVKYSTIYLYDDGEFVVGASNIHSDYLSLNELEERKVRLGEDFRFNYGKSMKYYNGVYDSIVSVMGVAIKASDRHLGYILVEHVVSDYLDENNELYLRAIANQIGVAIENHILYKKLQDSNKLDPLLGIYNRKFFFEEVGKVLESTECENYAIVMIDLDDFKKYNDSYGHQFGDEVLITISNLISEKVKNDNGIFARYGGEELIIFMDNVINKKTILNKIEHIRSSIELTDIKFKNINTRITASFGIAISEYRGQPIYDVINKADKVLYNVKNNGKNNVYII